MGKTKNVNVNSLAKYILYFISILPLFSCSSTNENLLSSASTAFETSSFSASSYFLDTHKAKIAYKDTGGNHPPVLLLHPMTGNDEIWQKQFKALALKGLRVIALSLRGAGLSGQLPPLAHQDSQDILALLRHLKLQKVHIVGAAAGGITALRFTVDYPDLVSSLVLSNTFAGLLPDELVELNKRFLPPSSLPSLVKELGPTYRYNAINNKEEDETLVWRAIYDQSRAAKLSALSAAERSPWYAKVLSLLATKEEMKKINKPILLIYGGADLLMPPPAGEKVMKRFNDAEIAIIPLAGHAAHWEFPEKFNTILLEFLQPQRS